MSLNNIKVCVLKYKDMKYMSLQIYTNPGAGAAILKLQRNVPKDQANEEMRKVAKNLGLG